MLAQRIASAVIGIPVLFGLIWVGGPAFAVAAAAALAVATAEFAHFRLPWVSAVTFSSALYAGIIGALAGPGGLSLVVLFAAGAAGCALGPTFVALRGNEIGAAIAWAFGGVVYVGALGAAAVLLRETHDGRDWVYLALFATFAVDTGAYTAGRLFGRHKMAPRVSPNKTWEGFAGGCAAGFAAVVALNYALGIRDSAWAVLLLGATLPIAATLGDLFESWMKRLAAVKDSGRIIPGHGGVLDRLDSLLFTFPLVYVVAAHIL